MIQKLPLKILYVEDEVDVRETVMTMLRRRVQTVYEACNGEEGLALFETHRPDLVISDIRMPVMDGLEMIAHIRKIVPGVKIYLTTAHNETSYLQRAIELGVDRYVTKPINSELLVSAVTELSEQLELRRKYEHQEAIFQQYALALDAGSIISKTDPHGNITYVNDRFCAISGYGREELIGKPHNIVRHPDMEKETFTALWETILHKQTWRGIVKNRRKDGSYYIVDATIVPILDESGEIQEFISMRTDLSALYAKEEEILRSKEMVESILDAQQSIVTFSSPTNGLMSVNNVFYETMPYDSFEAFRYAHWCICDLFLARPGYLTSMMGELNWMEYIFCHPEQTHKALMIDRHGDERTFQVSSTRIGEATDPFYVVTLTDITELERALINARLAERAKAEFLANMSHEIRTPLNGIIGFVDLLKNDRLSGQQEEFVSIIHKSAKSLLGIINDILDFSKIESGKLEVEAIAFNPREEFESVVELFGAKAQEKELDFLVFIDPQIPETVLGDPLRIKQVLANLISNAIKFTPERGRVGLEVLVTQSMDGEVALSFSVQDSGIGMTPEQQANLFKPFMQADNSVTRKYGGTGLGLVISQQLVGMMGGALGLESIYGSGSTFSFTLAMSVVEQAHDKPEGRLHIVLWSQREANPIVHLTGRYLESLHYHYTIVASLEQMPTESDVVMAVLDTEAPIAQLIELARPIVAIVDDPKRFEGWQDRISEMIRQPINASKLFNAVAGFIREPVNASKIYNALVTVEKGDQAMARAIANANTAAEGLSGRVLVAEDNAANQRLITILLQSYGLEVEIAEDGLVAVEKFGQGRYDLIFMDEHMPRCNGTEATRIIRAQEQEHRLAPTPIVALTANAIKGDRERLMAAGMDEYLAKPIDRTLLEKTLRHFLQKQKLSTFAQR